MLPDFRERVDLIPILGFGAATVMSFLHVRPVAVVVVVLASVGIWLTLYAHVWAGDAYRARQAAERLAADDGDWWDLSDYVAWRLRFRRILRPHPADDDATASIFEATRPASEGGSAHPRALYPLFHWVNRGGSVDTLALCVSAGVSDAELLAHLSGARPLDLEQVALLAALRGSDDS